MRTFKIEKTDTQCVVTWRYYSDAVFVWFLLLAALTVWLAWITQLPLWGLAILFLTLAVHTWSGKTKLTLDAEGLLSTYTNLIRKREKRFALTDIRRFEKQVRYSTGKLSSSQYTYLLRMVCQNDRASQSFGIPQKEFLEEELDDPCNQLNIFMGTLRGGAAI